MIDLFRTRRSVRKFMEQPIEAEKLELLKEAILRTPSSRNSNVLEFIFVDNLPIIEKLAVVVIASESKTVAWTEDCSIASILLQLTAHSPGLVSCLIQIHGRKYSEEKTSEI